MAEDLAMGRIIAVEARKQYFDLLKRNMDVNRISCVTPLHCAIWNEITTMDLESDFA